LVQMLLRQRRMHPDVSALVNRRFYGGRLRDHASLDRLRAAAMEPAPEQGTVVVSTEGVDDARAEHTPSQSRRNRGSARVAASLAAWFAQTVRVGLITPYNGQVALLKRHLKSIDDNELRSRIQVGTIHTFQGSEREVIIWDLVETADLELGRLFRDDAGRRLVNVAVSRAQGKLVVVGAPSAFSPRRSGSAKCLPLSQMLFANLELGGRQQPWVKVQARLGVDELPLAAKARARSSRSDEPVEPEARGPTRRIVR
jgi:superfamily I DNA and/or RNA helicase